MATITGKKIANTYKDLLTVNTGTTHTGLTGTLQQVQDGAGTQAPIQLSSDTLNVTGTLKIGGVALTANISALNATADLTTATGIVALDGSGGVSGRTLTAGPGVSIGNGNGVSGNPTIAINTTGITSASYGPFMQAEVNKYGQLVSVGIPSTVSVATLGTETLNVGNIHGSGTVSVTGTGHFGSALTVDGITSMSDVALVSLQATMINATDISVTNLFADNLTVVGFGTSLTDFTTNTIRVVDRASIAAANFVGAVSGTTAVFTGAVSVGTLAATTAITVSGDAVATASVLSTTSAALATSIANVSGAMTTRVDAVSVLTATNLASNTSINSKISDVSIALTTSIGNSNSHIAAVSVLTGINLASATSINSVIGTVSAALATSIGTTNTRVAATSLALATSIGNSNTVIAAVSTLTKTNLDAVTSINVIIGTVSSTLATSIGTTNTRIAATSLALATSIGTANTLIHSVSSALATSIANHLPLSGGTLTGQVSGTGITMSGIVSAAGVVGTAIHVTKNTIVDILTLTDAVSVSLSFDQGSNFALTLAGNRTLSTPTNAVAGSGGSIFVIQDGTGGRTLAFSTEWHFTGGTAPTLSAAAAAVDRIDYIVRTSTDVHAVASLDVKAGA